jgi:hypothetical protein
MENIGTGNALKHLFTKIRKTDYGMFTQGTSVLQLQRDENACEAGDVRFTSPVFIFKGIKNEYIF